MIALIAGQGALPGAVLSRLSGAPVQIWALEGYAPEGIEARSFRIEHLGSLLKTLTESGVTRVCFAGRVARPRIDPAAIDPATLSLVPRMMQALQAGDDGALRVVLSFFEEAGITPVAAHDLVPDLLPEMGLLVGEVSDQDRADLERARAVHGALSAVDVGQGCVVARGQVLAVEALPGTDWMLRSLAVSSPGRDVPRPEGGLLYKAPKPEQDRRVDLPAIGPETVKLAAEAGLSGIVIEAGGVMVLDRAETVALAEAAGLFLWVAP